MFSILKFVGTSCERFQDSIVFKSCIRNPMITLETTFELQYNIISNTTPFDDSFTSGILDPNILRRLEIRAEYSIKCSDVSDPIARSALMTIIEGSYNQVEGICLKG